MPETTTVTIDDAGYVESIDGPFPEADRPARTDHALVVREPERIGLARAADPDDMIALASKLATALSQIVEKQRLFTLIRGKKYPQVEAWMTIGRMDNVVAREASRPNRNDDGSWEAEVELVRLSDGMVVGNGSALCGAKGDEPWSTRADHQKRSMAVTRATSRAFRQQYSWIMALAGYEATPADEMPSNDPPPPVGPVEELIGIKSVEGTIRPGGAATTKLEVRQEREGPTFGFYLKTAKADEDNLPQVIVKGAIAAAVIVAEEDPAKLQGQWCRVKGHVYSVREVGKGSFFRMYADEFETRDYKLPADPEPAAAEVQPSGQAQAGSPSPDDEAELDTALEGALVLPLGQS